ncbi:MAG: polyphosphate kinase 2 family protein, partial [Lutibacter sp.]
MEKYKVTNQIKLEEIESKEVIEHAKKKLKKIRKSLGELQDTMYAENKYAALICLQGMDTAGKDSLIREVFKEVNVRGVEVKSFK